LAFERKRLPVSALEAIVKLGPEINAQRTNYSFMSCRHNAEQKHNVKLANNTFENVTKFKHLGRK
jgi:hypothetical protein